MDAIKAQEQLDNHKQLMEHLRQLNTEKARTVQLASLIRANSATWAAQMVDDRNGNVVALRNEIRQILIAYETGGNLPI